MQVRIQLKHLVSVVATVGAAMLLSGCSPDKPTTAQAEALAACVVSHATPERLRMMGEAYALNGTSGMARADAWDCESDRWKVALSSDFRKSVEPQIAAALTRSAIAREGIYAGTFGRQFSPQQRVVIGKLGMFFDDARQATIQGLTCGSIDQQSAQLVTSLDQSFAIAVLGVQGNIAEPQVAQTAATKLLERVNLLLPAAESISCDKDNGKERFTRYAKEMHMFYSATHPWAPGCSVKQDGDAYKLVCAGTGKAAK